MGNVGTNADIGVGPGQVSELESVVAYVTDGSKLRVWSQQPAHSNGAPAKAEWRIAGDNRGTIQRGISPTAFGASAVVVGAGFGLTVGKPFVLGSDGAIYTSIK
jgi:hypothetical protein